jgi:tetratricopeptide (TPR) repeat protein
MNLNRRKTTVPFFLVLIVLMIFALALWTLAIKLQLNSVAQGNNRASEIEAPTALDPITVPVLSKETAFLPKDLLTAVMPAVPSDLARPDIAASCRNANFDSEKFLVILNNNLRSKDSLIASRANLLAGNFTEASALAAKVSRDPERPLSEVVSALHVEGLSNAFTGDREEALRLTETAASLSNPQGNPDEWLRLMMDTVSLELSQGYAEDACKRLEIALTLILHVLTPDDPKIGVLRTGYAEALLATGKVREASSQLASASLIFQRNGGEGGAGWVDCRAFQIQILRQAGKNAESHAIFVATNALIGKLPVQQQVTSLRRFAVRLMAQGFHAATKPILENLLTSHRANGSAPSTLRGALTDLLICQLALGESEPTKKLALEILSSEPGSSLFDKRSYMADLALIAPKFQQRGLGPEAVRCRELIVSTRKEHFQQEPAVYTLALNDYAIALELNGDPESAKIALTQSLELQDKSPEHQPETLISTCVRLGSLYLKEKKSEQAFSFYDRAIVVAGKGPLARSPDLVPAYDAFAAQSMEKSDTPMAEDFLRKSLDIMQRTFGENAPQLAVRYNNLAALLEKSDKATEAEFLYRKALYVAEQNKESLSAQREIFCSNLIQLLKDMAKIEEAEKFTLLLIGIKTELLGASDPAIGMLYNNLATWMEQQGRDDRALIFYREAVLSCYKHRKETKKNSPHEAACVKNYTGILRSKGVGGVALEKELNDLLQKAGLL